MQANGMVRVGNRNNAQIVPSHTRWLAKRTVAKKTSVLTSNTKIGVGKAQDWKRTPFDSNRVPELCTTFWFLKIHSRQFANIFKYSRKQTEHNYYYYENTSVFKKIRYMLRSIWP
jgi:hypothetical protein